MQGDPGDNQAARLGRLRWRSRRGMLELELAMKPFVEERLADLSRPQQELYAALLEYDDWDIFDWIQGRAVPGDPAMVQLVDAIRDANTP
jgi:antitoxin CptB